MPISLEPTTPGAADTLETGYQAPSHVLVILASTTQPHRIGEVADLPVFERLYLGRGDVEVHKFAHFLRRRPGEPLAVGSPEGFLTGDSISRRQLRLQASAVDVEMEKVGRCVTLVNGVEQQHARLESGDTVMLRKELLLLCVRRQGTLPMPRGMDPLHPFGKPDAFGIVGESPAVWQLRAELLQAAAGDHHVLLHGESGSGKELAAALIHQASRRAKGPYVTHNASAFTTSLVESELFGNIANYPNPTMPARKGLVASADHGTLFLDEIGSCSPEVQAQLLRVMQEGLYTPLGESIARRVDVRIVGATNGPDTDFRADFRARFLESVRVPPLRERQEDIPLILRHLLVQHAHALPEPERVEFEKRFFGKAPSGELEPRINLRLVDHLVRQPLPLNVREVHAFLLQALKASAGDEVRMPASNTTAPPPPPPAGAEQARGPAGRGVPTKAELLACLEQQEGNVSRVARKLGMQRSALYRLMESYGIRRDDTDT